jgi:hypothetical protein
MTNMTLPDEVLKGSAGSVSKSRSITDSASGTKIVRLVQPAVGWHRSARQAVILSGVPCGRRRDGTESKDLQLFAGEGGGWNLGIQR